MVTDPEKVKGSVNSSPKRAISSMPCEDEQERRCLRSTSSRLSSVAHRQRLADRQIAARISPNMAQPIAAVVLD